MPTTERSLFDKIRNVLTSPLPDNINRARLAYYRIKGIVYYRRVFASFGSGSVLYRPMLVANPRYIHIGSNVVIRHGARLETIVSDPSQPPELRIGNNVNIEQNVHIVCHSKITIGDNVSITGNCAIVDVTHPYHDVHDPSKIGDRILAERSFVDIGDRSFLGFNTVVLPNVRIGTYCIIGAHSLVTNDVPDYSVVGGNPARILRRYDVNSRMWAIPAPRMTE